MKKIWECIVTVVKAGSWLKEIKSRGQENHRIEEKALCLWGQRPIAKF